MQCCHVARRLWLALTVWRSMLCSGWRSQSGAHSLALTVSQSHSLALTVSQSSVSRKLFRLALWLHLRRSGWRSVLKRGKHTRFQVCGALALCAALWLALWRSQCGAHSAALTVSQSHALALAVRRSQCGARSLTGWRSVRRSVRRSGWRSQSHSLTVWRSQSGALCGALAGAHSLTVSQSGAHSLTVWRSQSHSLTVSRAGALALTVSRAGPASEHAFYCHATTEENMRSSHHANMCSAAPRLEQMFDGGYSSAHPFWSAAARGLLAQASYFCSDAPH
jgi:hypothetical protein